MSTSTKILKIIFVILLLTTIGELGYYVYYKYDGIKYGQEKISLTQKNVPTSMPLLGQSEQNTQKEIEVCLPVSSQESILNSVLLEQLKFIPTALISSTVRNQYQGKIVEFSQKGGRQPVDKSKYKNTNRDYFEYQIGLKIRQANASETLDFYWDSDILTRIKIFKKEGKEVKSINFSDLQVGDEIEIYETLDLMKKNCIGFQCVQGFDIYKI